MTKEIYHFFSGDYENPTKELKVDITDMNFEETMEIVNKYSEQYDDSYILVFDDDGKLKDAFCY